VAGLELSGLELAGAVLAGSALDGLGDGLGLEAEELDGLGLDGLGLEAGGLDGPRVAAGGLDGLGSGVGLGVDGRWPAHASELEPVTSAGARSAPASPALAGLGLDELGLGLGLAGDALVGLGLTVGDGLVELGLTVGDGLDEPGLGLGLAGDDPAGLGLLAAGTATAGVDDAQLAAGGPGFWLPCAAAAPVPAAGPLPVPPAPVPPAPVPGDVPLMAPRSAPACASICCPNGVTTETLIAMMSVTAASTAARRARPNHGRRGVAGCATP